MNLFYETFDLLAALTWLALGGFALFGFVTGFTAGVRSVGGRDLAKTGESLKRAALSGLIAAMALAYGIRGVLDWIE